eukprot:scaffold572004_cov39-Prasinocladus_malaysianus.AAC.1
MCTLQKHSGVCWHGSQGVRWQRVALPGSGVLQRRQPARQADVPDGEGGRPAEGVHRATGSGLAA